MKAKAAYVAGVLVLLLSGHLIAQDTAGQRHEMVTNQLKRLAAEMSAVYRARPTSPQRSELMARMLAKSRRAGPDMRKRAIA